MVVPHSGAGAMESGAAAATTGAGGSVSPPALRPSCGAAPVSGVSSILAAHSPAPWPWPCCMSNCSKERPPRAPAPPADARHAWSSSSSSFASASRSSGLRSPTGSPSAKARSRRTASGPRCASIAPARDHFPPQPAEYCRHTFVFAQPLRSRAPCPGNRLEATHPPLQRRKVLCLVHRLVLRPRRQGRSQCFTRGREFGGSKGRWRRRRFLAIGYLAVAQNGAIPERALLRRSGVCLPPHGQAADTALVARLQVSFKIVD